jgi:hypothetical protein
MHEKKLMRKFLCSTVFLGIISGILSAQDWKPDELKRDSVRKGIRSVRMSYCAYHGKDSIGPIPFSVKKYNREGNELSSELTFIGYCCDTALAMQNISNYFMQYADSSFPKTSKEWTKYKYGYHGKLMLEQSFYPYPEDRAPYGSDTFRIEYFYNENHSLEKEICFENERVIKTIYTYNENGERIRAVRENHVVDAFSYDYAGRISKSYDYRWGVDSCEYSYSNFSKIKNEYAYMKIRFYRSVYNANDSLISRSEYDWVDNNTKLELLDSMYISRDSLGNRTHVFRNFGGGLYENEEYNNFHEICKRIDYDSLENKMFTEEDWEYDAKGKKTCYHNYYDLSKFETRYFYNKYGDVKEEIDYDHNHNLIERRIYRYRYYFTGF